MNPLLILTAIQAAIRLGRTGKLAIDQHARERDILLPTAGTVRGDNANQTLAQLFNSNDPEVFDRVRNPDDLGRYWQLEFSRPNPALPEARDVLTAEWMRITAEQNAKANPGRTERSPEEVAGAEMVALWSEDAERVSPLGSVVLTLADVALEFVGANPEIVGLQGSSGKLVAAIAANVATNIPDNSSLFGRRKDIAARIAAAFLRGGLQAVHDNPTLLVEEAHFVQLIENTLGPVLKSAPGFDTADDKEQWAKLHESIMGPAARAILTTVAKDPAVFFGRGFRTEQAAGALTQALLNTAADAGLRAVFTEDGLLRLYDAALKLAVERPELFIGRRDGSGQEVAHVVFNAIAEKLKASPPPFDGPFAVDLAATVVEAFGEAAGYMLKREDAWENVLADVALQAAKNLSGVIRGDGAGITMKTGIELVRIVTRHIAATPGMIAGKDEEIGAIVKAVADAMAEDEFLLLRPDDWLSVAAVAAEEAAANADRLFALDRTTGLKDLGASIIVSLLQAAAQDWRSAGQKREGGSVLFGDTLRATIETTLRTVSGNVATIAADPAPIARLAVTLAARARVRPDGTKALDIGRAEWLRLYRVLLGRVVATGTFGTLDEADLAKILNGEVRK